MIRLFGLLLCYIGLGTSLQAQSARHALFTASELGQGPVYVVDVKGLVDNGLARYLERALKEAEKAEAAVVVLHEDTFGGLVDAADAIRQLLLDSPLPTVAFVDRNAASAGALIAYAAHRIVMVPGSSIGAATVVEGTTGQAAPDKYQSYMRGQMRATAEARGRDPRLAEAMVDPDVVIPGLIEEGKVLTLSAQEAFELGVADTVLPSMEALLEAMDLSDRPVIHHHASLAERILRVLSHPLMASLLMLMMMGGLYFELQTPGVGFPGLMAALGAVLFFVPHYLVGMVESWEFVLFLAGVILLLVEIFILPGFGVAGIAGLLLVVVSLFTALVGNVGLEFPGLAAIGQAVWTLLLTLGLFGLLLLSLSRYLPRMERFHQLVLSPELHRDEGYTASASREDLLGQTGKALTPLRPSGIAEIQGERVDVITAGEYIPPDTPVRVTRVQGARIEVRAWYPEV